MTQRRNEILLSVIVPFFNAEGTIRRCVESLISQADDSTELIFINDGSTDGSADIIREMAPNAVIITHDTNLGTAIAATDGFEAATGKYVVRCDADDCFGPNVVKSIMKAIADEPDVIEFGMTTVKGGKHIDEMPTESSDINHRPLSTVNFSLCNRAIRRELIIDALPFPSLNCWEDLSVVARIMPVAQKVVRIPDTYYIYVRPDDATTLSVTDNATILHDRMGVAERLDKFFVAKGEAERFQPFLDRMKFSAKARYMAAGIRDRKAWKSTFPEINNRIMKITHIPFHHRLIFSAINFFTTT
ncbi:MAG: glycosyltransferase family 2 protein [Muribaculaceae bacterium]|nr:glycosyltransferase family 2 protein [Muribaculaceae bacterium]